jgi:sigma-E factor negative regulatory protein RseA
MDAKEMTQKQISALADGELPMTQIDAVLAALRDQPEARAEWDMLHQIGDALRSDELAFGMDANFASRMAARLALEPILMMPPGTEARSPAAPLPVAPQVPGLQTVHMPPQPVYKRFGWPGMAVAAAVLALLITPQIMDTVQGGGNGANNTLALAGANRSATPTAIATAQPVRTAASVHTVVNNTGAGTGEAVAVSNIGADAVILRDPRIDDYLMAHQRFSPSVYSTTQYARSVTFNTDSGR